GSGEALQRIAEDRLPRRDLRPAAARGADGLRDVPVARYAHSRVGGLLRRQAVGANDSLHRRVASGGFCVDTCLRGDRQRVLEPPALDDHRALSHRCGGTAMKRRTELSRRRFFERTLGAAGALALSGCDALSQTQWFPKLLATGEALSEAVQH